MARLPLPLPHLAVARRLGGSLVTVAVVAWYATAQREVVPTRHRLEEADRRRDCSSAFDSECCLAEESCDGSWKPVCGALPTTALPSANSEIATNYTFNYTFLSECHANNCFGALIDHPGQCDGFSDLCSEGCVWDQPSECQYRALQDKADQTFNAANLGMTLDQLRSGGILVQVVGMLYMFVALAIVCDEYFVPTLEIIVEKLDISDDVAGATFMAAGGSMPELATSFIGTFTGSAVGFGTIVGSAVFNVLFVIGMCAMLSKEVLHLTWWPLARDCFYYALSLLVLAVFFGAITRCEIAWWEALALLLLYVGYAVFMKYNQRIHAWVLSSRLYAKLSASTAGVPLNPPPATHSEVNIQVRNEKEPPPPTNDDVRVPAGGAEKSVASNKRDSTSGIGDLPSELPKFQGEQDVSEASHARPRQSTGAGSARRTSGLGDGAERAVSSRRVTHHWHRPSTFRAGVLQYLIQDQDLAQLTGTHVVAKIKGSIRETFDFIDADGDGSISPRELKVLLVEINGGKEVGDADVQKVLQEVGVDGKGGMALEPFTEWYLKSEQRMRLELDGWWAKLAGSEEATLGVDAMVKLIGRMTSRAEGEVEASVVRAGFAEMDADGDGLVTRAEFQAWYQASVFWKTHQEVMHEQVEEGQGIDLSWPAGEGVGKKVSYVLVLPIMLALHWTIFDCRIQRWRNWYPYSFCMSILWVFIFSYFMVGWAEVFGYVCFIPDVVMGLTVLAAGTSVPDLLTSVVVARMGKGDMAVSSSIGSNIFDVLVGLPLPWLCYGIWKGSVAVEANNLFLSIVILFGMLVSIIVTIAANKWKMTKTLGCVMFALYFLFVLQDCLRNFLQCSSTDAGFCDK